MTDFKMATWNVHEGLNEQGEGLNMIGPLQSNLVDILTLQEYPQNLVAHAQKGLSVDLAMPYSRFWNLNSSSGTGILVLSRWPIRRVILLPSIDPNLQIRRDNSILKSHLKGSILTEIDTPSGRLCFAAVHLVPFHFFDMTFPNDLANSIWSDLAARITSWSSEPTVIAGDFNGPLSFRTSPASLIGLGMMSSLGIRSTRTNGMSHDDLLYPPNLVKMSDSILLTDSDHHLCTVGLSWK